MGFQMMEPEADKMIYPKTVFEGDSLKVEYDNIVNNFRLVPLRNVSALLNMVDLTLNFSGLEEMKELTSTMAIVNEIQQLCFQHGIGLVIADIDSNSNSVVMERFCFDNEVSYVNISPDFSIEGYRNLPYDNHPNAKAHEIYSDKMSEFISKNVIEE
jgi:hypothetical protein